MKIFAAHRIERAIVAECASVLFMLRMELENLVVCSHKIYTKPQIAMAAAVKFWPRCARTIGVIFMKSPSLFERVCHPCSRKIRNLCKLFVGIKNATTHNKAEVGAITECRPLF